MRILRKAPVFSLSKSHSTMFAGLQLSPKGEDEQSMGEGKDESDGVILPMMPTIFDMFAHHYKASNNG